MTPTPSPLSADPALFLSRSGALLHAYPNDFAKEYESVILSRNTGEPRKAAGVLLPLIYHPMGDGPSSPAAGWHFQLIKRSSRVAQPGDLSCPGGLLHPALDNILGHVLAMGVLPALRCKGTPGAGFNPERVRLEQLFLANALREAWEEIRLPPFRLQLLGPLPTYSLRLFRRTIFPLAVYVTGPWIPKPNAEVERMVEIPVSAFFNPDQFGRLSVQLKGIPHASDKPDIDRPCLLLGQKGAQEEDILWGATLEIVVRFLAITLNYQLPQWEKGRHVIRTLTTDYLRGISPFHRLST